MAATRYRDLIVDTCAKMFAVRSQIHPANRNAVSKYLQTVWPRICTLTSSFVDSHRTDPLRERFEGYVESEEQRLRRALEAVKYVIDAMDTLFLVTGPGRIEKVSRAWLSYGVPKFTTAHCSIYSPFYGSFSIATSRSFARDETSLSIRMNCGIR